MLRKNEEGFSKNARIMKCNLVDLAQTKLNTKVKIPQLPNMCTIQEKSKWSIKDQRVPMYCYIPC